MPPTIPKKWRQSSARTTRSGGRSSSTSQKRSGVASIYLDDCMVDHRLARQLRAAGHLIYLPSELGVGGQADELHLAQATELEAVLVTQNRRDFAPLHHKWA